MAELAFGVLIPFPVTFQAKPVVSAAQIGLEDGSRLRGAMTIAAGQDPAGRIAMVANRAAAGQF